MHGPCGYGNDVGGHECGADTACCGAVAQFAFRIASPGPERAIFLQEEGVLVPGRHRLARPFTAERAPLGVSPIQGLL